jgi:hypothetical protein
VVRAATVVMQQGKYASTTTEVVFSSGSVPRSYLEDNLRYRSQLRVHLWSVNQRASEAE